MFFWEYKRKYQLEAKRIKSIQDAYTRSVERYEMMLDQCFNLKRELVRVRNENDLLRSELEAMKQDNKRWRDVAHSIDKARLGKVPVDHGEG